MHSPYDGVFAVRKRVDMTFKVMIDGSLDTLSVDRLKPAPPPQLATKFQSFVFLASLLFKALEQFANKRLQLYL